MWDAISAVSAFITVVLTGITIRQTWYSKRAKDDAQQMKREMERRLKALEGIEIGVRSSVERAEEANQTAQSQLETFENQVSTLGLVYGELARPKLVIKPFDKERNAYLLINQSNLNIELLSHETPPETATVRFLEVQPNMELPVMLERFSCTSFQVFPKRPGNRMVYMKFNTSEGALTALIDS